MESLLNTGPLSMEKTGLARNVLADEVAVVTGAGSNIGLATARSLAWLGAKVVIAELNTQTGAEAAALINRENKPGTALFVETDVANEDSMNTMAKKAFDTFGKVDILVNNAMLMGLNSPIINTTPDVLDRKYAVSTRGALLGIRAFLPGMLERRHGVVTYVGSALAVTGVGSYCAVKAATTSMMMTLAAELGDVKDSGIAIFWYGPGLVGRRPREEESRAPISVRYKKWIPSNMGYEGIMPPEDTGAALAYCIVHAPEIHGSGVSCTQVQKHLKWSFPRPDLVPKRDFDRLSDTVTPVIYYYMGQGFAKPGEPTVSINRSDAQTPRAT